jgi:hypothetical protein
MGPSCSGRRRCPPRTSSDGPPADDAARLFYGTGADTTLVVESPRGLALTPISWDFDDPNDPGCPSIVRNHSVIGARVDNGHLVILVSGSRQTYVQVPDDSDDTGARGQLVQSVYWGKDDGHGISFRHHDPQYQFQLGQKIQPRGDKFKMVPWAELPWTHTRRFHIAPDGTLRLQG